MIKTTAHDFDAHDLGGAHAVNVIDRSRTVLFAHAWEASVFGMTLACGMLKMWNLDQSRSAREQMKREHYLAGSYYEHWLHGLELLLVEHGIVSEAELRSGKSAGKESNHIIWQSVAAEQIADILSKGAPTNLPAKADPLFIIGERVRVKKIASSTHTNAHAHTRAPRYVQQRNGVIVHQHGAHIFPDEHAACGKKQPQHLYSVRFEARELWGEETAAVYVDLFESYLQRASK